MILLKFCYNILAKYFWITFSDLLYEVIKINGNIIEKPPCLSIREIATCDNVKLYFHKQPSEVFYKKFHKIHKKIPLPESLF